MNEETQEFMIIGKDGKEQQCRVVITFDAEDKSYVLFSLLDETGQEIPGDLSAMTFDYDDNTGEMTNLQPVETDAEWEMINEVVLTLLDEFEEEPQLITVTDEEGKDQVCEVIHTFSSEQFGKSYVLYVPATDEPIDERDIFAAQYIAGNEGQIEELYPIESDEEWEFVEEVLNTL
ncbi:DUF1292 domain-containing protein [Lysinibacillus sp. HST-98]|uniref:DUF1292 domain-containing protein n=1 Tax=Lysinibacillus TaxID=400634 RepID=UPI0001DA55DE|nr:MULTISPECIES: DUF1292 domain-containing protein [Lysinibacillus]EFI69464.1 hypothetical protein BFZC1_06793 [Lysinibacillus fusiformis ZC1]EKU41359.1 hypothetical protein C518_3629 [Lysinibacillus fusiformis ZB2]MBL3728680.1 DUF1292 domain-containing protein [Lysinibacillus sp. HST-98]MBU5251367.1 DUF1292 domain-containing protein [Lysinibacillus capsici]MED4699154.1 DUF1292 domain-containing protein [Lysinibacillus capsici]